jgi:predicted metal-dependent HD superfamily phosphohydrolase
MENKRTSKYQQKIINLTRIASDIYQELPYHNFYHALDVWSVTKEYGILTRISEEERFVLESAALLHDIIYVANANDNEEKSAELAKYLLPRLGYSNPQIEKIKDLIMATKWPTNPKNFLEQIICDADLDNLGREDFFERSVYLLKEWGITKDKKWYDQQAGLLKNNHYYTKIANKLRGKGKAENIKRLEKLLQEIKC